MNTDKLFADVKALLQAAGLAHITMRSSPQGTLVSADHEDGTGAVFFVTTNTKRTLSKTANGGRAPEATTSEAMVVPSSNALLAHLAVDPLASAELLGMSSETLRQTVALTVMKP